jgi:hypothetical protein
LTNELPSACSNVAFIDTLLITPGGMGLAECGELLGLPKLTILHFIP